MVTLLLPIMYILYLPMSSKQWWIQDFVRGVADLQNDIGTKAPQ